MNLKSTILNIIFIFGVCLIIFGVIIILQPSINNVLQPRYTNKYYDINVSVAKQLINDNPNLTIIDCTGGCQPCAWKSGHIANAIWDEFPENYYNYTSDILVYDNGGIKSSLFCQQLVNHTYGKIYNLVGGYLAWKGSDRQ